MKFVQDTFKHILKCVNSCVLPLKSIKENARICLEEYFDSLHVPYDYQGCNKQIKVTACSHCLFMEIYFMFFI